MNSPTYFSPQTLEDFCGPARQVGQLLLQMSARGGTHRILLKGEPGTGKSSLAKWFARHLACQGCGPSGEDWNIMEMNGTKVGVDAVDQMHQHIQYASQGCRVVLIDEADAIPVIAQTRMLSFLDHVKAIGARSKPGCNTVAVLATSNLDFDKFQERMQTRFKPLPVLGPSQEELVAFMRRFIPPGRFIPVEEIAKNVGGNVRAALDDLDTALLASQLAA